MPMTAKIKNNITMSSATYGSAYITKTYQFGAYITEKKSEKNSFHHILQTSVFILHKYENGF